MSINWRLVPSGTVATRGVHPSFIKNKRRGATSPWVSKNPTWIYIYSGLPRPPDIYTCMYVCIFGWFYNNPTFSIDRGGVGGGGGGVSVCVQ